MSLQRLCLLVVSLCLLAACGGTPVTAISSGAQQVPTETASGTRATTLPGTPAPGATTRYFVAPTGDDQGPGTLERPWRTIQHAADRLQPGEAVYVRAGTYRQGVSIARSGTPGHPITFAAQPGETVILDGGGTINAAFATDFSDPRRTPSDITISGFTIRNYRQNGIAAWSTNDRLTLTDLVIEHNRDFGILISNSDGTRLQRVHLRNNVGGFSCSPIEPQPGPGCTHLTISDAEATDNGTGDNTGLDAFAVETGSDILVERTVASGGPGDGFDFKSDRTTLTNVIAHHTRNNIKLWGKDSTITNALAYDAHGDANVVLVEGGSYTVTNLTVANMVGYAYLMVVGNVTGQGTTPVRLHNSILFNDNPQMGGTLLWFGPSVQLLGAANNLYFNPYRTEDVICAEFPPHQGACFSAEAINGGTWIEAGGRYADPRFVNPASKDFHLRADSPAINAGTTANAPPIDLDNQRRDDRPDIGAYEFAR